MISCTLTRWLQAAVAFQLICCIASNAQAAIYIADTNAEIRVSGASGTDMTGDPSGIREFNGATSTLFFNVEGSANAPFEVFAVADFLIPAVPGANAIAPGASLTLFEDPASFAVAGTVEVYLAADASASLIDVTANPSSGVPSYQTGQNGFASIDPVLCAFPTLLGSVAFTPSGTDGTPNVIDLDFSGDTLSHAPSIAQMGGALRLIVAPGDAEVAFTGAGQANSAGSPPTLNISFVPEPGNAVVLLGSLAVGLLRRRLRRP